MMKNIFFRISYKNIGVYEALKNELWKRNDNPKEVWELIKNSKSFNWLKTPPTYSEKCLSYFTEEGYKLFLEKAYPIFVKYLDKKFIKMRKFYFDDKKLNIMYRDKNQIVVEIGDNNAK